MAIYFTEQSQRHATLENHLNYSLVFEPRKKFLDKFKLLGLNQFFSTVRAVRLSLLLCILNCLT